MTTKATRTMLTALALAAGALAAATVLADGASAKPARGFSVHGAVTIKNSGNGVGNSALFRRATVVQAHPGAGLPVTTTCGLANCAPAAPAPITHKPPLPPIHDPGSNPAPPISSGVGGGDRDYNCDGDRDCGIFRQN